MNISFFLFFSNDKMTDKKLSFSIPKDKFSSFILTLKDTCEKHYYQYKYDIKENDDQYTIDVTFIETDNSHLFNDQFLRLLETLGY
jgi:hypothetical protein